MRSPPHKDGRRVFPRLEFLEGRDCPAAPAITALTPMAAPNGIIMLMGNVADENPGSVQLTLSGAVSGVTWGTLSGQFMFMSTTGHLGTVYVQARDSEGLTSQIAQALVSVPPPTVTLKLIQTGGRNVTLSGQVTGGAPGMAVTLSGQATGTAILDATGSFSYSTVAAGLGTISAQFVDVWGQSAAAQASVTSNAPTLTMTVTQTPGRTVAITGQVNDESPCGSTVSFSGSLSATVTTGDNGYFSYTGQASGLGTISATAWDCWGLASNTAQATLTSNPPSVSMTVTQGANRMVYITGQASDEYPSGLGITLSGPISVTVTTDTTGHFSYSGVASALGTLTATAVDCWGLTGAASYTLTNVAPIISNFQVISTGIGNYWTVEGQVADDFPAGLAVHLNSTIAVLNNVDVTVGSDGWFTYTVQLQNGATGAISAFATDWWGVQSNTANTSIV